MFRRVDLPARIAGSLLLHGMPGRFEALEKVWHQLRSEAVGAIVCLTEKYEIGLKSSQYAAALETGSVPCSVLAFEIREGGVPEDRDAFWTLANDVAQRLQCGEAVLIHCAPAVSAHRDARRLCAARPGRADGRGGKRRLAGGLHGGNHGADRNAFLVRGARFNFVRFLALAQREAEVRRSMARIGDLGWHARLHVNGEDPLENSALLRSLKDVPMVIDRFGHVGFEGGMDRPVIRWVLDVLKQENWWLMVSNGNRDSKMDAGWDDALAYARHSSRRRRSASFGAPTGPIRSGPSA